MSSFAFAFAARTRCKVRVFEQPPGAMLGSILQQVDSGVKQGRKENHFHLANSRAAEAGKKGLAAS
jgi:hypothetical protein